MILATTEIELEEWLSRPTEGVRTTLASLDGDILILGAAGKMGPTLAKMARRALPDSREVIAVSRFSKPETRGDLEESGVKTIVCDLLDREAVAALPDSPNIIYMAGHKFGTDSAPELTWMMNAVVPAHVAERYHGSKIVVFSTGCVYPFVDVESGGATELSPLDPPGEYANSCIARERIFTHYSLKHKSPTLLFRLNYAVDLRYGVLHDVALKVFSGEPVDVSTGYANLIWQGDANARALQCLAHTESPPVILNVTGPERVSVREIAERFGRIFGKKAHCIGSESSTAWLANADKSISLFGPPTVSIDNMIEATAHWLQEGGGSLGKPTHFESRSGQF